MVYCSRINTHSDLESIMALEITEILAIGNGEKCPFCKLIIEEDTDTLKHMQNCHKKELNNVLFGGEN